MQIFVKVKTKTPANKVEKISENIFIVFTKEAPEKGRANQSVIKLLADYFKIPSADITIARGLTSKNKIIKIKF